MANIFEIPKKQIELLSGGKLYKNIPSVIELEDMVTDDENLLYSNGKIDDGEIFKKLIQKKIKTEGIDVNQLLIGDFNQLLIEIRCTGYGEIYQINTYDADLEDYIPKEINLRELKKKPLGEGYNENGEFTVKLPVKGGEVNFMLPTVGLGQQINAVAEKRKDPITEIIPYITTKLEFLITSINGETDREYIRQYVKIMSPRDRLAITKAIDAVEPDVQLKWTFETEVSKTPYETDFMLGLDFFYPQD